MNSPTYPQDTAFSRDVIGRFVCNGLDEALASIDPGRRPDARPFDAIIIGGGTFGSALASSIFERDKTKKYRVLVLEAGPFALTEHVQNIPMPGVAVPDAIHLATIQAWQAANDQPALHQWSKELWGLAWHSPAKFPGLAYYVGGRSLFWGGWSPRLLDAEMPDGVWPAVVKTDLQTRYFREASEQIGVTETNDFIQGDLHFALRQRLFDAVTGGSISGAIPLAELPLHLDGVTAGEEDISKLEAPLAVQCRTRPGAFPLPDVPAATAEPGFVPLFNGFSLAGWTMAGSGGFAIVDGALESFNGTGELGLLWHQRPAPGDFTLRLEWRAFGPADNSGVFIRFPDPDSKGYVNTAWVGVHFGFEVQIDESGPTPFTRTGAIYDEPTQVRTEIAANPPGVWNEFEIQAQGQHYTVKLNGVLVSDFNNPHVGRGLATTPTAPSYIGLQSYPGTRVQFRNIRVA